jgi:phospholipid/cholesterol/gamma-HCH transport system substrate-binding protein
MEAKNKRPIIVGIFILLAIIIFITGVLTLGGQRSLLAKSIGISATFDDVGGLTAGNNIWFAGVKVGTISKIVFDSTGHVHVMMNLEEKAQPFVKKDAKAKVGSDGLIGNKLIVLYGGSPNVPSVEEGDVLGVQKALGMDDIMATLQDNNKNLLEITNNFKDISKKMANGQGTIGKLLNDETLANQMDAAMTSIRQAAANAQRMTASVADYTAKLQRKGSLTNDLISDTVIFSRLRHVAIQIDELSRSANTVVDHLNQTAVGLDASLKDPNTPVGALLHDGATADNLKQTVKNLQTSTQKLDENMEALQHNFLLRGFFKKKNKAKDETGN